MARIRSIHPGLFTDEAWMQASPHARLLLIGILTEADDHGIFEWKPIRLKIRVLPCDDGISIPDLLKQLEEFGLIKRFTAGGRDLGAVRNFCKWQRPKSPKFDHPTTEEILTFVSFAEPTPDDGTRFNTLRKMVWEKANGACVYCDAEVTYYAKKANSMQIDHRVPVSRGGSDDLENLACACRECNSLKSDMTDAEFRKKFAKSELQRIHGSRNAKNNSGEATLQREEGEERREEKDEGKKSSGAAKAAPPDTSPEFVRIPTNRFETKGEQFVVTENFIEQFQQFYPAVDVRAQVKAACAWSIANTDRRKTLSGMKRFINDWLAREQNRGGKNGGNRDIQRKPNAHENHRAGWASLLERDDGGSEAVQRPGQLALEPPADGHGS